jgi:hypothetical protein
VQGVTTMTKLTATLFWLVTVAVTLFPPLAEAGLWENHNETLLRDDI